MLADGTGVDPLGGLKFDDERGRKNLRTLLGNILLSIMGGVSRSY